MKNVITPTLDPIVLLPDSRRSARSRATNTYIIQRYRLEIVYKKQKTKTIPNVFLTFRLSDLSSFYDSKSVLSTPQSMYFHSKNVQTN